MAVRKSDFAGSWYPGNASECLQVMEEFSRDSITCPDTGKSVIAGIVPHAGWYFSGRIAYSVIQCLKNDIQPDTVVIFGRHLHPGSNNYIMKEGAWATPLGVLDIDKELGEGLVSAFPFHVETDFHYEPDNTIELQLPFIKYFFPETMILPIGVPPTLVSLKIGERTVELAQELGRRIVVIGSTDLTHYGYNYGYTPKGIGRDAVDWVKNKNDKTIINLMLNMSAEEVIHESLRNSNACCSGAAATTIAAAKRLGADRGNELIYCTSYDIRPDNSFVGYVGIVYS